MSTKIIIGADVVPTSSNYTYFKNGDIHHIIGTEIEEILNKSDYSIFNLEVPLTDEESPISKCGPNLIAPTYTIKGLKKINPYFFTLANNHILDQGNKGLQKTIEILKHENIAYSGAGNNLEEARKPYIININDIKIGIYCCAEHEFTIADKDKAGANPYDPLESFDHVKKLKEEVDFVIVLYHGGKEHYRYPSPNLQKVCRKFIEKGADLLVCQHSHCIGCKEEYMNGTIVYGQGNFLFDHSESEFWKTSLLLSLEIEKTNGQLDSQINYYPLIKNNECVRLAKDSEKEKIMNDFLIRSDEIKNEENIEKYYSEFSTEMIDNYLSNLSGKKSLLFRGINKLTHYRFGKYSNKKKFPKSQNNAIRNFIECEAHRELLLKGISNVKNSK